jgi:surfactin synthase thioesterase subunit
MPSDHRRWIRIYHPGAEEGCRLVCFPHAGGSASYYFPFATALRDRVEVLAVQYPGRQDRRLEPLIDNIPELADRTAEALAEWSDRPFAFFGHSMGAVLAFEVALRLGRQARPGPVWFFASGRRAPSRDRADRRLLHRDPDAAVIAELRRLGGTDQRFLGDEELLASILPVARNDYRAIETYAWLPGGPKLTCPVTALVGEADPQTTLDEAGGWREHAAGEFDLRTFPGGHFYLDTHRTAVIDVVSAALGRARAGIDSSEGSLR